ncbi:tRNA splicing 2' phosphotransferase 1 [Penicillium brasilianum]|uniref:2'-phosphotransferase n=1 Tax=Penicillium brasilianum TaxID=104259 RepID=A0A1S9RMI5_PENBI|nr:tRNA splicing 2' phosphotransferase 1 [Penicillium brasilianum]
MGHQGKDRRDGGRGGGGRGQGQSRDVQVSKALSLLLRHAAEKEGVKMNAQGYANVADVLAWRKLKSIKATFDEIKHAVESSDKKRFALLHIPSAQATESTTKATLTPTTVPGSEEQPDSEIAAGGDQPATSVLEAPSSNEDQANATQAALASTDSEPSNYMIRATQGHTIQSVDAATFLEPLTLDDESKLPQTVVHGTFHGAWPLILQSGGLRAMGRHHVHFATGPSLESTLATAGTTSQEKGKEPKQENQVISGMRRDAQILIYLDIKKALAAGCPFWRSENGVILSEGLPVPNGKTDADGNPEKIVSIDFFDFVIERKLGLGQIWPKGDGVKELPESAIKKGTPKNRRS